MSATWSISSVHAQRVRLLAAQRAVEDQIAACWAILCRQQERRS